MRDIAFDERIIDEESKNIIKYIFIIGGILILFFVTRIFIGQDDKCIISVPVLIKIINGLIAIASILSCLILYKRTKESIIFILVLVYVGIAIAIITGQIDYLTFYNFNFKFNNYLSVTTSLLRVIILFIAIMPKSKIYNFIIKYKVYSFIFVTVYCVVFWEIEKRFFIKEIFTNKNIFSVYIIFVFIAYMLVAIKLLLLSIKENKVIIGAFSVSLFLNAIKVLYIFYGIESISYNMKLISVLLTYISFISIIIGTVMELYLLYKESMYLNKELRKFYNLANNNRHSYMYICDKDFNISFMNNKIREDYNYNIDEEGFKEELLKNKASQEKIDIIKKELYEKKSWRGLVENIKKGAMVDCSIQLIKLDEDESQIVVSYVDISETIKMQAEIEAHKISDVKKSEFISTLSHELKTPLNIFYSTVQLLDKTKSIGVQEFSNTYDKYKDSLKLNSKRMLRLVNNIVDSTRIDTGEFKPEFGNYEIISIVEDIVISTVPFAESKNITIEFDTDIEENYIKCDPAMIEKIVLNLVSNSIKYTKDNGLIRVNISLDRDYLKIFFEDTGVGIPQESYDKIFDRFSRVDCSLKRVSEGSGIGLNIVKSMIEAHNGSITVQSKVYVGSVFEVTLPNVLIEDSPMIIYEFNKANTELELSDIYS